MKIYKTSQGFEILGKVLDEYESTKITDITKREIEIYVEIFETSNFEKYKASFLPTGIVTDDIYLKYDFTTVYEIEKIELNDEEAEAKKILTQLLKNIGNYDFSLSVRRLLKEVIEKVTHGKYEE